MSKRFLVLCAAVALAACTKKNPAKDDTGAVNAADRATTIKTTGPVDESPLPGIDISKLDKDKQKLFYKLVGSLTSPCGKGESLRASFTTDTACKRAPFAVRYVAAIIEDDGTEVQVREEYEHKYNSQQKVVTIDVSKAPKVGNDDAPVKMIEFFDYECPHCQAFKPMLEQVEKDEAGKVVVYYMMFPLEKHTDSKSAAQAAVAANQMGKFFEMHEALFKASPAHSHDAVVGYAKEIGLDPKVFEDKYAQALPQVQSDLAQGDAAGVDATPTLFFNGKKYDGLMHPKYLEMWIDEEIAVNR